MAYSDQLRGKSRIILTASVFRIIVIFFGLITYCSPTGASENDTSVEVQIRYRFTGAEEVRLLWGIDGWKPLPPDARPTATFLDKGVMHTPMHLEGDALVATVRVPADSTLNYGFLTLRHSGTTCSIWESGSKEGYHFKAIHDAILNVASKLVKIGDGGAPLVYRVIQYLLPGEAEVFLVWTVPSAAGGLPSKPHRVAMTGDGNRLEARIALPVATRIVFAFYIASINGRPVDQWDGDLSMNQKFSMAAESGLIQSIKVSPEILDSILARNFHAWSGWLGLVLAIFFGLAISILASRLGPLMGRAFAGFRRTLQMQLEAAPEIYQVSRLTVRHIWWAPLAILVGALFYLTWGFVRSPISQALYSAHFRTGYWNRYIFIETHPIQILGFILLFLSGIGGITLTVALLRRKQGWIAAFYALFSLGVLLVGMEEINWAQSILGFESPQFFQKQGNYGATSLHNLRGFHQYSAHVLQLVFGIGGIMGVVLTLIGRWKSIGAPAFLLSWFVVITVHAGLYGLNEVSQIGKYFDWVIRQLVEVIETLIAASAALYLWLNSRMLLRNRAKSPGTPKEKH